MLERAAQLRPVIGQSLLLALYFLPFLLGLAVKPGRAALEWAFKNGEHAGGSRIAGQAAGIRNMKRVSEDVTDYEFVRFSELQFLVPVHCRDAGLPARYEHLQPQRHRLPQLP